MRLRPRRFNRTETFNLPIGALEQMKLMTDTVIQRVYTEPSKAK